MGGERPVNVWWEGRELAWMLPRQDYDEPGEDRVPLRKRLT